MKCKDEAEWQQQLAELAADPSPYAAVLQQLVVTWADRSEAALLNTERTPIEAMRLTLRPTLEQLGHIPVVLIGQAMLILCAMWEPAGSPEDFWQTMTSIEQCLYIDQGREKMAKLIWEAQQQEDECQK